MCFNCKATSTDNTDCHCCTKDVELVWPISQAHGVKLVTTSLGDDTHTHAHTDVVQKRAILRNQV